MPETLCFGSEWWRLLSTGAFATVIGLPVARRRIAPVILSMAVVLAMVDATRLCSFFVRRTVVLHGAWAQNILIRVRRRDVDSQRVRRMEGFTAIFATDSLEFPGGCSARGTALNMAHMLFKPARRKFSMTMRAFAVFRVLAWRHAFV